MLEGLIGGGGGVGARELCRYVAPGRRCSVRYEAQGLRQRGI